MQSQHQERLRERLLERKELLHRADSNGNSFRGLDALIRQVDTALRRIEDGSAGSCRVCQGPIETERLAQNPLVEVCLECLTEAERAALEQDLRMAAQIQLSLLPKPSLQIGRWDIGHVYEPLGLVSGDYCDILFTDQQDASIFFLVGDVSGKGVAASMTMAQLHATFRSLVPFELPLSKLVERVNRLFSDSTLAATFATLVVGRLDHSGEVELCNAGHNPPLVVRPDRVSPVHATGTPIGLFANGQFDTTRFHLGEDDLLLLYTDGVTESQNSAGLEFGLEQIVGSLPGMRGKPAEFVARTSSRLASDFRGAFPRNDDSTIMAIRRTRTYPS